MSLPVTVEILPMDDFLDFNVPADTIILHTRGPDKIIFQNSQDLKGAFILPRAHTPGTKEKNARARGRDHGFVQFQNAQKSKEALEKMNGFDLADRPDRIGPSNDKFTPESTANLLHRFQPNSEQSRLHGSAFPGAGGRGHQNSNFDRSG